MFESYSKQAVSAARASLRILDAELENELELHPVQGLPANRDWQYKSFADALLNREKKGLAQKRADFNSGVIYAVCSHHFDGKPKHVEDFCVNAIKGSALFDGSIAKMFKKGIGAHSSDFRKGVSWGEGFVARHISFESKVEAGDTSPSMVRCTQCDQKLRVPGDSRSKNYKITCPSCGSTWHKSWNDSKTTEISGVKRKDLSEAFHRTDVAKSANDPHLIKIDEARSFCKRMRQLVLETESRRFDYYRYFSEETTEIRSRYEELKREFHEKNLLISTDPSANWWRPADWEPDWSSAESVADYRLRLAEAQPNIWYPVLAEKMIDYQIDVLKRLNEYFEALGKLGFDLELVVDPNHEMWDTSWKSRKAFEPLSKFLGRGSRNTCFHIVLTVKSDDKYESFTRWSEIDGYMSPRLEINDTNSRAEPAEFLSFSSNSSPFQPTYSTSAALRLLEQFEPVEFEKIQKYRKSDNAETSLELQLPYWLNFIYHFEYNLACFKPEQLPINELKEFNNNIVDLVPVSIRAGINYSDMPDEKLTGVLLDSLMD
jgi:hypothetical protein